MNEKNFFVSNFLNFIINEESFFKKNQNKFTKSFCELVRKLYPQCDIESEKELVSLFYENLFIKPYLKNGNFSQVIDFLHYLNEKHIEFNIINKAFLLLANKYIKYIFSTSNIQKLKTFSMLIEFYSENLKSHIEILSSENNLPKEIFNIFTSQQKIYVFGVYKGIPISHSSKILTLNQKDKSIKVHANNYQIIASKFQKDIYLLEPKKNLTLKAFVEDIDPIKKILTLSHLEKIKRSVTKRNYLRVQPKEEIKAFIIHKDKKFEGTIYDLSIKGISILTDKLPLEINEYVTIEFSLFIKERYNFHLMSQLRSISSYNDKIRYHFYFEPPKQEEILLEKYIKTREKEIIKELMFYLKSTFIDV